MEETDGGAEVVWLALSVLRIGIEAALFQAKTPPATVGVTLGVGEGVFVGLFARKCSEWHR